MMPFLKTHGWKALGAVLVLYSLGAGLFIPLKPGILQVDPVSVRTDSLVTIQVQAYNTRFTRARETRAWLKLSNEFMILSDSIAIGSDVRMHARFHIPPYLPIPENSAECALVIDNEVDGAFVKPSAVFIRQTDRNPDLGFAYWRKDQIEGLHSGSGPGFPYRGILEETIRNTYFHVPMWFGMIFLFLISMVFSIRFLQGRDPWGAEKSHALNQVGLVFGVLGLVTGAMWARFTWNAFWSMDVKQNMAAIATLIYLAYFLLWRAFEDPDKRERLTSAYNILAFITLIPLLFIIPRMTESLHPGNGGNPAMGGEDLDHTMRLVFYPAVAGWILVGYWIANLVFRLRQIQYRLNQNSEW